MDSEHNSNRGSLGPPLDFYYDFSSKKKRKRKGKQRSREEPYLLQSDFINRHMDIGRLRSEASFNSYHPPADMILSPQKQGFVFGHDLHGDAIGKPQDKDGHIIVFGGSGTGKTTGIVMPNFHTWGGRIFVLDFKGDITKAARKRHPIVLHLCEGTSNYYYINPFHYLKVGGENNLITNARALSFAIIPLPPNTIEPFWIQSAREILTGAIVYYFNLHANFIDAMVAIKYQSIVELIKKIASDDLAKICVSQDLLRNEKTIGGISIELQNHISAFATDQTVQNFLSSSDDDETAVGEKCELNWEMLNDSDIILRIDHRRMDQWSPVVRLFMTQLIDTLQTRPEKYSTEGLNSPPILLMLDEFPQLGKMEVIPSALKTIRSKNVTIALFCQSLADLDETYGAITRRTILDNCPFKAILGVYDAETQQYFAKLVGTYLIPRTGCTANFDSDGYPAGYSIGISVTRDYIIQPNEFSFLDDLVLIHPNYGGFCRLERIKRFQTKIEEERIYEQLE